MKRKNVFLGILLSVSLLAAGCGKTPPQQPAAYSNLKEESVRYDLDMLLQTAGVSDARRSVLFSHVDQMNGVMKPSQLTEGFTEIGQEKYDPYDVQDQWMEAYPDFLGYNCRITSFSLLEDVLVQVPEAEIPPSTLMLEFDLSALDADNSAFPDSERKFLTFFSPVSTENTKNVEIHLESVKNAWLDRGIRFEENANISMINMFFHMQDGDNDLLYVGHSGVLLPTPDGELWFLEKLAFQKPYQVVKFADRRQLQEYLMQKYDLDQGQPVARPFIMENDRLMKT